MVDANSSFLCAPACIASDNITAVLYYILFIMSMNVKTTGCEATAVSDHAKSLIYMPLKLPCYDTSLYYLRLLVIVLPPSFCLPVTRTCACTLTLILSQVYKRVDQPLHPGLPVHLKQYRTHCHSSYTIPI